MSAFKVIQPGLLTLIQDAGRYGQHRIGLTNGGPLDALAFNWANRLCENPVNSSALEISIGGLVLEAETDTYIAVTGATMPLKINGRDCSYWQVQKISEGDKIEFGFATAGARAYLAVKGGFNFTPSFTSTSTVARESIGGINGGKLMIGDLLPCTRVKQASLLAVPEAEIPHYPSQLLLKVVLGYQQQSFDRVQQRLFFSSDYQLSDKVDRMGFRLQGQQIKSSLNGILSEGICHGAIQIPADGQPIVLMNDRQTIGGYPKIGSVIALDTAKLSQLMPGNKVAFEQISMERAHNINHLARQRYQNVALVNIA
ncbi:MAG: biotin-dependent carboxyltransferase family protein [Pseudomonadales bacterium]|nr:biotin-dependent carboxyltransferase family protein [Pseudomonadales bacterium]NRA17175.1 biotin-dependent carboxyltransferase [Oceanospirillaceae bacterium]